MKKVLSLGIACGLTASLLAGNTTAEQWKFGLMADTQWPKKGDDGKNPNSVAVDIINQVNREFIRHQVKFVIAVGDITDDGSILALDTRATYAQALYNAGIAFYPLRGNHESSAAAAAEFKRLFPQTINGMNNNTPADAFVYTDSMNTHPVPKKGGVFSVGSDFESPSDAMNGLSYSFTYNNAKFVLLDQFTPADGSVNTIDAQQSWITSVLSSRHWNAHAFVFGHKGLITEDHEDGLFGNTPSENPAGTNAFITSLFENNVRFYFGGHDHMHNRALVTTTDGSIGSIQELILASDSYKFYTPSNPSRDAEYDQPAFGRLREFPLSQELYQIGYYIVTVDGSKVGVDYYAVPSGQVGGGITTTPELTGNWRKHDSFGYSMNGKEFFITPGSSYSSIRDNCCGTRMRILGGINDSTMKDASGRPYNALVETGWLQRDEHDFFRDLASNVVTLSGMNKIGKGDTADLFAIGMTYDKTGSCEQVAKRGMLNLATKNAAGKWVNAVENNFGGVKKFVDGPWNSDYGLGTYGIDVTNNCVWAVVNYNGVFAAALPDKQDERFSWDR